MKISKKTKSNKIILPAILAVLLIAGTVFFYIANRNSQVDNSSDSTPTSLDQGNIQREQEQAKINADNKQRYLDQQNEKPAETPEETPISETSISLTAKNEDDVVVITTNLDSVSGGTCTLTITSGAKTVTKTASVIYTPEYSSCAGFSIEKSELASSQWSITLSVKTNASTITKSITHTP